jgi:hypothetical protein
LGCGAAGAGETATPDAATAPKELCRTYWFPLYAYVRRQGHTVEDAQDLTQQFLLEPEQEMCYLLEVLS